MVQGNLLGRLKKSIMTKLPGLAYSGKYLFLKCELFTWLTFHFQESDHKSKDCGIKMYISR